MRKKAAQTVDTTKESSSTTKAQGPEAGEKVGLPNTTSVTPQLVNTQAIEQEKAIKELEKIVSINPNRTMAEVMLAIGALSQKVDALVSTTTPPREQALQQQTPASGVAKMFKPLIDFVNSERFQSLIMDEIIPAAKQKFLGGGNEATLGIEQSILKDLVQRAVEEKQRDYEIGAEIRNRIKSGETVWIGKGAPPEPVKEITSNE